MANDVLPPPPGTAPADGFSQLIDEVRAAGGVHDLSLRAWLALAERWRIEDALQRAGGNRSAAARSLGIGRRTLYTKMEKLRIEPRWRVRADADASG